MLDEELLCVIHLRYWDCFVLKTCAAYDEGWNDFALETCSG